MNQLELMKRYLRHIHDIIPENLRQKYHLVLGDQIIGTYDTFEEMKKAELDEFMYVACVTYMPSPPIDVK